MDPSFLNTTHGYLGCTSCHGGNSDASTMEEAHAGVNSSPSSKADDNCGSCHADIVENCATSIHATLKGIENGLYALTGNANREKAHAAFDKYCFKCHATCGACHVAKPAAANGGLIKGHKFFSSPDQNTTCNACHGGRVSNEFKGGIEGFPGDVHYEKLGFDCLTCHDGKSFHGDGSQPANKSEAPGKPSCLDCHPDAAPGEGNVEAHNAHPDGTLDCYICHATVNKSCYNCHVGEGAKSKIDFKIGMNTRPDHKCKYSVVRHMPGLDSMLDPFEPGLMAEYNSAPNWKTSMVHNIQRITPRNKTCKSCHNNSRIFLTEDRLDPADSEASKNVVVRELPPKF
ncbi:MAG: hypothetical protein VB144_06680 [Clostridia bacterium]|nr:hypothetical protein [Clostridia bacterium]